jgi:catechol 2,3-dioxygenase-like lactoylglutathione lyase family enzyme
MEATKASAPQDIPRLFRVILPVSNIDRAERFYSRLLGLPGKRVSSGRHYFDCGGTILACFDPRADTDPFELGPNPDHIYFAVADLEAVHARAVELNAEILSPIGTRPWGERSFYLKDPFGNKICFVDRTTMFTG